ncbi:MAG: rhodanese-like domain-containing protein [Candidatus Moranbacteria bacterium]|nr:rhodanese-like domain-containing protein [Candidatus Moranbacteria bacterium]
MFNFLKKIPELSPYETSVKVGKSGVGFIDVRTEQEYKSGHARGAKNIPLDELSGREGELQAFDEVYIICQSGGRSASAVEHLLPQGINAINVSGGTTMWKLVGLAME